MKAPTSTVGSSPAATSRWPSRAVVVDLPCVPVTPRPMWPGRGLQLAEQRLPGGDREAARDRRRRARRDRGRRGPPARSRRGRCRRGGPDRARPRTRCRPPSSGGVYGDGPSASQPSTIAPARCEQERGAGRSGAGDADDVDPLAALDHALAPRRPGARRARAPPAPTRACCPSRSCGQVWRSTTAGPSRSAAATYVRPTGLSADPAVRARRCRSPRRPASPPGSAPARRWSSPRQPRPRPRRRRR